MATTLLLKANDIARLTSISGNTDIDALTPWIFSAQLGEVKRVLTDDLYTKIVTDYDNDALSGVYETIYTDYVSQMLVFFTAALFISVNNYKITNAGIYKVIPENGEPIEESELNSLVERYRSIANGFELAFITFMKYNEVPEYGDNKCDSSKNSFGFPWLLD